MAEGSIQFVSLACGHTDTCLRAIKCGCLSTHPILSDGTRYDIEKIRRKDLKFAKAVETGLEWWVLQKQVLVKYPDLLRVFDASRNAASHVATPESEITGMNKLFVKWAKDEEDGEIGSYVKYLAEVLRSRPPWGTHVKHMLPFLQNHAGGIEGEIWKQFQSRRSHTVPSGTRMIARTVFQVLANVKDSKFAYAAFYSAYNCPDFGVVNKYCVWFTTGDFNRLIVTPSNSGSRRRLPKRLPPSRK